MDWQALKLSAELAIVTLLILLPLAIVLGRWLAITQTPLKPWLQSALALPLVLPPTVLGFYLLLAMGGPSSLGAWFEAVFGHTLAFSFAGLVVASVIFNIPFAVQPVERAFQSISSDIRDVAVCCGMSATRSFWRIEFPLAWPGILSAAVLTFAHTMGEFGVVLMVGGSIPGETRTIAISIYDRVQGFDYSAAGQMSLVLLVISLLTILIGYGYTEQIARRRRRVR
jgi:molybdate transport system permease protein